MREPVEEDLVEGDLDEEECVGWKLPGLATVLHLGVSSGGAQPHPGHEQGQAGPEIVLKEVTQ